MRKLTKFEQHAFELDMRPKVQRPSWEHTVETYQGNGTKVDWFLVDGASVLVAFGAAMLWTII
jgi:hypothetical protein